jgi:hypothetical protein
MEQFNNIMMQSNFGKLRQAKKFEMDSNLISKLLKQH